VLADCTQSGLRTDRWAYKVYETGEKVGFTLEVLADEIPHPFNLHLGQSEMTRILLAHLAQHPGVSVEWATTVTSVAQDAAGATVVAEGPNGGQTYRAGWVVGADGSRSVVRRELGLAFAGMTWPERFVATNLRFDFASLGFEIAGYQLDADKAAIVAQVDSTGLWRYTHAEPRTLSEETIGERVRAILAEVLPPGADPRVESSYAYRIHQRSADRFRIGRAVLVGDAAHLTNPTLGLGMTSGLFDAFALIEALAAVIHGERDEEILDRYSEARRRNFWEFCSPTSSEAKEFVFPLNGDPRSAERLQELREIAADPDAYREYVRSAAGCATPSLLSSASTSN
jgi:3-(3-hydroxy-phenyl)propionate hydroxylase